MSSLDAELWQRAVEDPESLPLAAWTQLTQALAADPALRQRLVAERQLHERLSRLYDAGRGDLGAALSHRLDHVADHPHFVRRVVRRSGSRSEQRRWTPLSLAAAALLAVAVGIGFWCLRSAPESLWINGPATVALVGGGSVELDRDARWRDEANPFLERGGATLEVAHRNAAPFVLRTPQAAITVLGTRFRVNVAEDTSVAVQRGLVRLEGSSGTAVDLTAGERGRCAGSAPQRERVLFSSGFAVGEPAAILVGRASPLDPDGKPDPCVAAGSYATDNGPRVCVSIGDHIAGLVRSESGLHLSFRWWAEPHVGPVLLQVWDAVQQRNYVLELGAADGQWRHVSVPITRLHPFAGVPQQDLRPATGDRLLGVLLVGTVETGRLYLDDLVLSVPE